MVFNTLLLMPHRYCILAELSSWFVTMEKYESVNYVQENYRPRITELMDFDVNVIGSEESEPRSSGFNS